MTEAIKDAGLQHPCLGVLDDRHVSTCPGTSSSSRKWCNTGWNYELPDNHCNREHATEDATECVAKEGGKERAAHAHDERGHCRARCSSEAQERANV